MKSLSSSLFSHWCLVLVTCCLGAGANAKSLSPPVDFNRDVRPILSDNCFACHGPDQNKRKAKLRLDTREGAFSHRGDYAIVLSGKSSQSELYRRITAQDEDDHMPPAKSGKKLTPEQIALVRRWIDEGARWQDHWSLIKPERPPLPPVKRQNWPRNEIDYFVLARLEKEGLKPSTEAEKPTLIRRASLDLTGLPPTIAEVEEFLADKSSPSYEKVVERLLQSPRYGEHVARHWLDLARYADSNGYQYDTERSMWRWRDWVIDAFNQNMPFDQFTIEQLAGDLLPEATLQQKLATAFNRNHPITIEGGIIDEEYRTEYVVDRVSTTSTVWLGLTMACARCHDHKYDPISQRDFYRFFAFFNQVPEKGHNGFSPLLTTPTPAQARELESLDHEVAAKQKAFGTAARLLEPAQQNWEKLIATQGPIDWQMLDPQSMKSSGGATLTNLEDKSILVSGENPAQDNYEIVARVENKGLTAIRLEALTHESLPHKGPGRGENANFILSEFEVKAVSLAEPPQTQTVSFASAYADHSQKDFHVTNAIDGKINDKGWAVDGHTRRENRTAVFIPNQPFGYDGGTELHFRLRHEAPQGKHGIGRPRLSVTTNLAATIPLEIQEIIALAADKRDDRQQALLRDYYLTEHGTAEVKQRRSELAQWQEKRKQFEAGLPTTMVMQDMAEPRETFILVRGQYDKPGEKVTAGAPAKFPPLPEAVPVNRLGLAKWLMDPSNPLTARVAVNRFWEQYFGTGLVKTSENFGLQGEAPSHPELLDWLATEFVRSGWDTKYIQRLIVTSAAYRQFSRVTPDLVQKDPENRLLARGPRLRLSAEVIRDSALAASGLLVEKIGGPSVYPYQPPGLWKEINDREGYSKEYVHGQSESLYRRSVYSYWKRTVPPPTMQMFDAPEREFCVVRRSRTTTPLQALALLHDPQFVEAARHLAERIIKEGGTTPHDRITFAFRLVTTRMPKPGELNILRQVYDQQRTEYQKDREAALKLLKVGDSRRNESLDPAEHAAWATVARMLLNLDEAITKG